MAKSTLNRYNFFGFLRLDLTLLFCSVLITYQILDIKSAIVRLSHLALEM